MQGKGANLRILSVGVSNPLSGVKGSNVRWIFLIISKLKNVTFSQDEKSVMWNHSRTPSDQLSLHLSPSPPKQSQ